jgi:UDP-glucose 4-epimerase
VRVLVTGGAGFVGTNLVRRLLTDGYEVTVLDDLSTGLLSNLEGLDLRFVEGTLTDPEIVAESARDAEVIVHLGARGSVPRSIEHPVPTHEVNATGTLNVLEAARATGAYVVFSSSSSVFGANPQLPKTERSWTQPMSPYAASKLAAEGYVMGYRAAYGMPALVLRFFNIFGPWQRPDHDYAAVIPKWLWKIMNGEPIEVHGDGTQTRDFTYVNSIVDVLLSAIERRLSPDSPVNLAFGRRVSLNELLAEMEAVLRVAPVVTYGPPRPGDVRDSQNDPRLLLELFPETQAAELAQALRDTAEWLSSRK